MLCCGAPRPSLSTSSMSTKGLLVPVDLRHCTTLPGMAPTYVRRCPLISATSESPPTEKRKYLRSRALAMDLPTEVLPTPVRAPRARNHWPNSKTKVWERNACNRFDCHDSTRTSLCSQVESSHQGPVAYQGPLCAKSASKRHDAAVIKDTHDNLGPTSP